MALKIQTHHRKTETRFAGPAGPTPDANKRFQSEAHRQRAETLIIFVVSTEINLYLKGPIVKTLGLFNTAVSGMNTKSNELE